MAGDMADDRKPLAARVSQEAHDGWLLTPRVYGATTTTLAEVIGRDLAQLDGPLARLPKHWRVWLAEAAQLERTHRGQQGKKR